MQLSEGLDNPLVVVKIGGSILRSVRAYPRAARFLSNRLQSCTRERLVVVVSAQNGVTDCLESMAKRITQTPNTRLLDLLWSTGETRSAALLALHLERLRISAVALSVHETGLKLSKGAGFPDGSVLEQRRLREALSEYEIVVVPGFLATDASGVIRSLGRGGSDLTAVLLAKALGASRCELIKDVPGYFSEDPRINNAAQHIAVLSHTRAIQMAEAGCQLVQQEALELAAQARLSLVVRSLSGEQCSVVVSSATGKEQEAGPEADSGADAVFSLPTAE